MKKVLMLVLALLITVVFAAVGFTQQRPGEQTPGKTGVGGDKAGVKAFPKVEPADKTGQDLFPKVEPADKAMKRGGPAAQKVSPDKLTPSKAPAPAK
jgi:hypothetical protein